MPGVSGSAASVAYIKAGDSAVPPVAGNGVLPVGMPQTVDVTLDDGTSLRVPVMQQYVLNPLNNQPYALEWGFDKLGAPTVVSITLFTPPGQVEMTHQPGIPANRFEP